MPQKFLKVFHTPPIAVRGHGSLLNKQLCFGSQSRSFLRIGHRRPHSFIFAIAMILREIPCCIRLFPTPIEHAFPFSKFLLIVQGSSAYFFCLSTVFSKSARLFSRFKIFSNFFSNLSLHDQILHQIWSQGGGACSGVTPNYSLYFAL